MQSDLEFLSVDEAARLVGLSHWTIRKWMGPHVRKLTRYRSAARTVVSRAELLEQVRPVAAKAAEKRNHA